MALKPPDQLVRKIINAGLGVNCDDSCRYSKLLGREKARAFSELTKLNTNSTEHVVKSKSIFHPSDVHVQLQETVRNFTEKEIRPQAKYHDANELFNHELFKRLGSELGILGITVSEQFGGAGLDATAVAIALEEICSADPGFGLAYLAHTLLFAHNLYINGNDEQRRRFLPRASSGELIGGMCMSEPGAGTDVLGMTTQARKEGNSYVLNGAKMWITNGVINGETGDAFLVYAKTSPKDISFFLVEKGMAGFSVGQQLKGKLGMRASNTAELVLQNVKVPAANLIGHEGEATKHMMRNLEMERIGLAAMSLGIGRRSIEVMINYSKERKAYGKPLNNFGQIQAHIATSYAEWMAAKSYVYQVAANLDIHAESSSRVDSDGVKLFAAQTCKNIADRAIQCLGGYGYVADFEVERLWRDAKLLEIGGGTNEAHQKNMTKDMSKLDNLQLLNLLSGFRS